MDEIFLALLDCFRFRMVDGARLQIDRLAVNHHFVTGLKVLLHERQVPPAAVQPRRAVVENEFEHRFAAAAPAFDAARDDFAARGGCLVQGQPGNGADMPAVFIAPRPVKQQIEDGMESEPGELRGALRADAAQRGERRRERTGGRGRCRRFGHATFIKSKTRSPKSKVV